MSEEQTLQAETKRDRVRRILVAPLQAGGMRFRRGTPEDRQRDYFTRLCDELAYLGDEALAAVQAWAKRHGDGEQRCFWPPLVAMISTAEAYQCRPLEEVPKIAGWFRSVAGARARAEGRLVAELKFWERFKRPPINDREHARIAERAAEWTRRVQLAEEKLDRGVEPGGEERAFLRWYRELELRAERLVQEGEEIRATKGDAA